LEERLVSRIVLNQDQLDGAASLLQQTAGEYQAIGSRVAHCDCGCMPADVAALVDAVIAEVRSRLAGVSLQLATQASDLAWRAAVDQSPTQAQPTTGMFVGGFGFDPAFGGAGNSTMSVGGFDGAYFPTPVGVSTFSVGGYGSYDPSSSDSGNSTIAIGGSDGSLFTSSGGGTFSVGGFDGGFDGSTIGANNSIGIGGWYDPNMVTFSSANEEIRRITEDLIARNVPVVGPVGPMPQYLPVEFGSQSNPWASIDLPFTRHEYWGGRSYDVTYYPEDWNRLIG
jgi:hypothetical protein